MSRRETGGVKKMDGMRKGEGERKRRRRNDEEEDERNSYSDRKRPDGETESRCLVPAGRKLTLESTIAHKSIYTRATIQHSIQYSHSRRSGWSPCRCALGSTPDPCSPASRARRTPAFTCVRPALIPVCGALAPARGRATACDCRLYELGSSSSSSRATAGAMHTQMRRQRPLQPEMV